MHTVFYSKPSSAQEEGAPDVFETPEVPADFAYDVRVSLQRPLAYLTEHVQHDDDSDSDNLGPVLGAAPSHNSEDIVGDRIAIDAARSRFKNAKVNGDADFSIFPRSKRRKERPVYPPRLPDTTSYGFVPRGYSTQAESPTASTSETALQRLRRLRIEMEEVEAQLESDRSSTAQGSETDPEQRTSDVPTGALLAQLRYMRNDLLRLTPKAEEESGSAQVESGHKIDLLRSIGSPLPVEAIPLVKRVAVQNSEPTTLTFDERLDRLERFVGAEEAAIDEATAMPPPLLSTLTTLEYQLQLLTQPRHLDTVARRVKTLVGDLERMHEARRKLGDNRPLNVALPSGITVVTDAGRPSEDPTVPSQTILAESADLPPDTLQKIDALFTLLPRVETLLPLAPQLLTRLKTLAPLHATAAEFGSLLSQTQREAASLKQSELDLRQALDGLTKSIEGNEQVVRGNLENLQQRVAAVSQRMDAFKSQ